MTPGLLRLRHPGAEWMQYLPSVYADPPPEMRTAPSAREERALDQAMQRFRHEFRLFETRTFFERFLRGFEDADEPRREMMADLRPLLFTDTAPADLLLWLATWVALVMDENSPELRRRRLIREAVEIYRWRGTRRGLSRYLEIFTGVSLKSTTVLLIGMGWPATPVSVVTPGSARRGRSHVCGHPDRAAGQVFERTDRTRRYRGGEAGHAAYELSKSCRARKGSRAIMALNDIIARRITGIRPFNRRAIDAEIWREAHNRTTFIANSMPQMTTAPASYTGWRWWPSRSREKTIVVAPGVGINYKGRTIVVSEPSCRSADGDSPDLIILAFQNATDRDSAYDARGTAAVFSRDQVARSHPCQRVPGPRIWSWPESSAHPTIAPFETRPTRFRRATMS